MRAVGPEIVLAASSSNDDPTRAGPNRGWEALAGGLGNIVDPGLLDPDSDAEHTYADEGGRIQFRTEGDELRMVTHAGTLKVTPASMDPGVDPHSLAPWQGDVGIEAVGDGRIVFDEVDVWVNEQDRMSRSLHAALPRYVSQDFSEESKSPSEWEEAGGEAVTACPGGGKPRKVLVTMAWSRKYFPREPRSIWTSNYYRVPILDWQPRPFYPIEPYTGWSVNSVNGMDNGIGPEPGPHFHNPDDTFHGSGVDRKETTSFTRNYYCDYSEAAVDDPTGEQQFPHIREKVMRVYPMN